MQRELLVAVAEAKRAEINGVFYRVDDDEDLTGEMVGPRLFSTVEVNVTNTLDLRDGRAQELVGLGPR